MYAATQDGPWLLYDMQNDPWEECNLVDDPACADIVAEFADMLAERIAQTGDSWEYRVDSGDCGLWQPATSKMRANDLGTPWPGSDALDGDPIG